MVELLHRYFIIHKTLGIPGIGNFFFQRHKATFDFGKKVFTAPHLQMAFRDTAAAGDKHLYAFISKTQKIAYVDAIEQFQMFAASLKKELEEKKTIELTGIGALSMSNTGQLTFAAEKLSTKFYPEIFAERVARNTTNTTDIPKPTTAVAEKKEVLVVEQPEERKTKTGIPAEERWWLFALILALIAMAAIFYYYYTNGSLD